MDVCEIQLPSVMALRTRERSVRKRGNAHADWATALANGSVGSKAELARQAGVSRAAVTVALNRLGPVHA